MKKIKFDMHTKYFFSELYKNRLKILNKIDKKQKDKNNGGKRINKKK